MAATRYRSIDGVTICQKNCLIFSSSRLTQVQELGNAKAKKPKDTAAFSEICEAVKPHLDNNEDVPLPLLAKLLKWKLLAIKQKDLKRREDERKVSQYQTNFSLKVQTESLSLTATPKAPRSVVVLGSREFF